MAIVNLLDIAQLNGRDAVVGLLEEVADVAPEVFAIPGRTIRGTSYTVASRTSLPTVSFRNVNEGWTPSKSGYESKLINTFVFGGVIQADKAAPGALEDGPDAWKAIESKGVMESAVIELGQQTFYGTVNDSKGFPGLLEIHNLLANGVVIDAGGTTATTGSSVWMLNVGAQGVQYVFGDGDAFRLGDWTEQQVNDAAGKPFPAYVNDLYGYIGLQVASKWSIGRLKDMTAAEATANCTDAKLWDLWAKFPIGRKPNLIIMSRRSMAQLQKSRTVVINATGSTRAGNNVENVPPPPDNFAGIPIIVTDSLVDTETLS